MELRDQNGRTEKEYLAQYTPGKYERPSVTVDVVVLARCKAGLRALLIKRGGHPCLGLWALPGGFVEPKETTDDAAARELEEETHVKDLKLYPLGLVSTPGRDPRHWTMTQPYAALVEQEKVAVQADDDAVDARWFDIAVQKQGSRTQVMLTNGGEVLFFECEVQHIHTPFGTCTECTLIRQQGIAFDHGKILCQALELLG